MHIKTVPVHIKTVPVAFKAGPDDGLEEGEFIVYPSTFTRTPDAYGDVVAKGAFLDTIKQWKDSGNVLPGLFGHRLDDPEYYVAGAIDMGEDDHGWWVKGKFDMDDPKGLKTYKLVKGKRLSKLSFAYSTLDEGKVELDDGTSANELRKLDVFEFSFVPVPANSDASVLAVKDAAAALAKAGRVLSAKNEQSLREARDSIDSVLSSLGEEDGKAAPAATHAQEQASGTPTANVDASAQEPVRATASVSAEEPKGNPSVSRLAAQAHLYALTGGKES